MVTRVLALPDYLDLETFDEVLRTLLHQSSAVAPHRTGSVIAAPYSAILPHRYCLLAPRCASILVCTVYKRQLTAFQPVSAVGGKPPNRRCATRTRTPEIRGSGTSGSALLFTRPMTAYPWKGHACAGSQEKNLPSALAATKGTREPDPLPEAERPPRLNVRQG